MISPRPRARKESSTDPDLASLGLSLLAASVVSAALAAVVLYQRVEFITWGDPEEAFWWTVELGAIHDAANPFVVAAGLLGWTGLVVAGSGASRLWTRRARGNHGPAIAFAGLSIVTLALMAAFLFLWEFETFAPTCVGERTCTSEEYSAIFYILSLMTERARLAAVAYVVVGSAGVVITWFGLDRMRRGRESPREGGLPPRSANPTSGRRWP